MTIRLVVSGATGRMGRQVVEAAQGDSTLQIVGAIARPDSPLIGQDVGQVAGVSPLGVRIEGEIETTLARGDVAIDFTNPVACLALTDAAARLGKALVIGTTGLSPAQRDQLAAAAQKIPILFAANMSLGVNLVLQLLPIAARALGDDYDIEITETHHRYKKDAPSGTANRMAEVIAEAMGKALDEIATHGRNGIAPRQSGEIGIHALRAGGNIGEHTVLFANDGEQIEIRHRSYSRQTFARGAISAARFIVKQSPGLYSINDLLSAGE